jgi:hypothetical protein
MACITLMAPTVAMATTPLTRVIGYQLSAPQQQPNTERQPLRMNWVVVTGSNGSRVLRMQWVADGNS